MYTRTLIRRPFPSPEDLKYKILLKGDRSHAHEKADKFVEGDEDDEDEFVDLNEVHTA